MLILYHKDTPDVGKCRFHLSMQGDRLAEVGGKLKYGTYTAANDSSNVGWFSVPDQPIVIPDKYLDEDGLVMGEPTIAELNLTYYSEEVLDKVLYPMDIEAEIVALKARLAALENPILEQMK